MTVHVKCGTTRAQIVEGLLKLAAELDVRVAGTARNAR